MEWHSTKSRSSRSHIVCRKHIPSGPCKVLSRFVSSHTSLSQCRKKLVTSNVLMASWGGILGTWLHDSSCRGTPNTLKNLFNFSRCAKKPASLVIILIISVAKSQMKMVLKTFALIVSAHSYCARNSLRHALSARAVEEMWRYIALVGTLVSMYRFNSLKCSLTPCFLLIDHFLCQLSTFWEKLKKICIVEVWFFQLFCLRIIELCYYCSCTVFAKVHLSGWV